MFDTQIKAGSLPASRTFDIDRYVAGGYLERARAAVAKEWLSAPLPVIRLGKHGSARCPLRSKSD